MRRHSLSTTSYKLQASARGFTLVEMIVAVGLFAIVMTVSTGALLSLVAANRKAQAVQSVVNNLSIAVDGMVRSIRMGTVYRCGTGTPSPLIPADCNQNGDIVFAFEPYGNTASNPPTVYAFDAPSHCITRKVGAGSAQCITAPEVNITDMKFYVVGSTAGNESPSPMQPKVVVVIKGSAGGSTAAYTTFHLQATAVQRQLDI